MLKADRVVQTRRMEQKKKHKHVHAIGRPLEGPNRAFQVSNPDVAVAFPADQGPLSVQGIDGCHSVPCVFQDPL